jgi:hypothetical protein
MPPKRAAKKTPRKAARVATSEAKAKAALKEAKVKPYQPPGSRIEDLRVEDYTDGWTLFDSGVSARTIAEALGLTMAQVKHLYTSGLRVGDIDLPSFKRRRAMEEAGKAAQAGAVGERVASRAGEALVMASDNAKTAAMAIRLILALRMKDLRAGTDGFTSADLMAIRTLRHLQDVSRPAAAYALVFGHHPSASRALMAAEALVSAQAGSRRGGAVEQDPGSIPAAIALMTEKAGATAAVRLKEDIISTMSDWTPEQLLHYAETGEEPGKIAATPNSDEIVDAEFTETD